MGKMEAPQQRIMDGKAEAERGREEQGKPSELNPLKKLNQLT